MNKSEAQAIVNRAAQPVNGGSEKAAFAADQLHANARCYLTVDAAAALVRWQALFLNGEWDTVELDNVLYWMRHAVIVGIADLLPDAAAKARALELERKYAEPVVVTGGRFARVEL